MNRRRMLVSGLGAGLGVGLAAPALLPSDSLAASVAPGQLLPGIDRIVRAGVLRSGVIAADNPPFFHTGKDGQVRGIDVEAATAIAEALGVKLLLTRSADTFGELFGQVVAGRLDLAFCKLSRTVSRAMQARLTLPYAHLHHAVAFNRERLAHLTRERSVEAVIKSFSGSIGVIGGTTWGLRARQAFPGAAMVEYPDWNTLVEATRSGKVMACYRDDFEIKKLFKVRPELTISLRGVILTDLKDSICGAVAPDLPDLNQVVNAWLELSSRKYDVKTLLALY